MTGTESGTDAYKRRHGANTRRSPFEEPKPRSVAEKSDETGADAYQRRHGTRASTL